jgi:dienelactone hydrolase
MDLPPILGLAVLALAPLRLAASSYDELKRVDPVPSSQQIPIVDFVRSPQLRNVQLNHTGTEIGAIVTDRHDNQNLLLLNLVTGKVEGVSAPKEDADIETFIWLEGDHLAYLVTFRKVMSVSLYVSQAGKLTEADWVRPQGPPAGWRVIATTPEDRNQILVDLTGGELRYDHPEIVDAKNHGALAVRYPELRTDHGFNTQFVADKMGKLEFGTTQEDGIPALSMLRGEEWVKCPEDLDEIDLLDAGNRPGEVVVLGKRDGRGPRPLEFLDAQSGKPGNVILQDSDYDFDGWFFRDPKTFDIVGAVYDRTAPRAVWFTDDYKNLQMEVDQLFPGQIVWIMGMDDSGTRILICSGSDRQPYIYSLVDLGKHTCSTIQKAAPWIDPNRMQPMKILKYATAEGRQIDAYLTLPAGATKANPPPLVVIPNPSSSGRWTWEYNNEVQFLASRGYAVLQPNHRGSAGYTWMYPESEDWDFRKMSDDVARAVRRVTDLGLADAKRVAILGEAFGGYLAVSGIAFEPGTYKCAAAVSAYVDWGEYIRQDKYLRYSSPTYSRFLYKLGDPDKNPDRYREMSPLPNAAAIRAPLLMVWGEYDDPEMIGQDKRLASELKGHGGSVETHSFSDEAEGIRHLDHREEFYKRLESFLAKNL